MNSEEGKEEAKFFNRKRPVHQSYIERHNQPVIIYLTVCTKNRRAILACDSVHEALLAGWVEADSWLVGRYMIMPDHIHLFCSPGAVETFALKKWVKYWKRLVSLACPELSPIWQRDGWDCQLRRDDKYDEKWAYVVLNPMRKGLVERSEDWPYQGEVHKLFW